MIKSKEGPLAAFRLGGDSRMFVDEEVATAVNIGIERDLSKHKKEISRERTARNVLISGFLGLVAVLVSGKDNLPHPAAVSDSYLPEPLRETADNASRELVRAIIFTRALASGQDPYALDSAGYIDVYVNPLPDGCMSVRLRGASTVDTRFRVEIDWSGDAPNWQRWYAAPEGLFYLNMPVCPTSGPFDLEIQAETTNADGTPRTGENVVVFAAPPTGQ